MAERLEHRRILALLELLDTSFLAEAECWFAGGTAISLRCGEFRISRDVDFLCSSRHGYRLLRERVFDGGARSLFRKDITLRRELRADRYGIRFVVDADGTPLKFEIVSEGRIDLAGTTDDSLPVPRLNDQDLVAEKLLANEDRFLDDAAMARDIVDLIMLEHELGGLPESAFMKARQAYGDCVDRSFLRALQGLRDKPAFLQRILDALSIAANARPIIETRVFATK